jgi:hypothetical protein
MDMLVEFATDQLNVADWPREIVCGSAVKLLIRAACGFGGGGGGGGGASTLAGGGGGGGAAGAFFLQPAAASNIIAANTAANTATLDVLLFIRILTILASSGCFKSNVRKSIP